jgi:hypothetical protein
MPFLLDNNPSQSDVSEVVNYLLSNFSANLSSDPNNGQITGSGGQVIGYLYKYMMVRYADSFDGTVNFSNSPTNRLYYGLRNDNSSTESTNPADYIWYKVAGGGFDTTKRLYYKVTGGRTIELNVSTTSPGFAWVPDTGSAIDLDALTMAFTVNAIIYQWGTSTPPARPSTSTTYDWINNTYTAPAGWYTYIPPGGTPGAYLWSITIMVTQTGGLDSSLLDWTNPSYPIIAVGINGVSGTSGLVAYLVQNQASPTPAFSATTIGPNPPSGWSLVTPAVAVGQVLWYIQGQYNSSDTTVNGVPANSTAWTGPIAASVFQDIRSDNWNGSNPPTPGNPATYGTQGYYIQRSSGAVYLNSVYARNYIEVGGAATDVNAGVTTVSGGKITANSITASQIAADTITGAQIAANTITASEIAANTITASQIASSTITSTQIAAGTILAGNIASNTITSSQIAAATISAGNMAANSITAGNAAIANATVDTLKIAGDSVSIASFYSYNVTGADNTVTINFSMAYAGEIIATIAAVPVGGWFAGFASSVVLYWDNLSAANSYSCGNSGYSPQPPMPVSFSKSVSSGANSFQVRVQHTGTVASPGALIYVTLLRRFR